MSNLATIFILVLVSLLVVAEVAMAAQTVPLPVTLNGEAVGELSAEVEDNRLRALDIAPIRGQLQDFLAPEYFRKLPTNQVAPVPVAVLESAGIKSVFNFESLLVELKIPVELRRSQTISLLGNSNVKAVNVVPEANFSAYMNVRGGVDYVESSQNIPSGFDQPQIALENAFNFHRLVLETETAINPAPDKTWEKRDTRLVYDLPAPRIRLTAGDLNYPVVGFQNFISMVGFSVNRQDSLQPYRVTSPLGQSAFFLKSDSKVDVIINGHIVQSLQMSAGPHQINNFPLTGGANNVVLRLTDSVGRVEYINARMFYDPGLLKAGESAFNYAVGFPSISDPQSPIYHYDSQPAASAYHRWGITDQVTAGVDGQATAETQIGGAEVIFSTLVGTIDLDAAFTHDQRIGTGAAQQLQYHYYAPHESLFADGQFTLAARHQSPSFTSLSPFTTPAAHGSLWNVQVQYSQNLGEHWFAGIGYSQQLNGDATQLATASLIGGYRLGRIYADVTLDHNSGSASHNEWTAFFSLRIDLERGHSLFATYDTSTRTSRTEWQYTPPSNIESVSAAAGVQTTPRENEFYGNLYYTGRRADLSINQDALSSGQSRTSLRWGTALVYADGVFGISQPVQDSFALVRSTGSLREDGGVGAQPQVRRFLAQEDWLGPGVLPQLTGYYPTHIVVEPRRSEADFDPQEGDVLLQPTYRSGTLVQLGHPATIDATVKLIWSNGQPVNCQDGRLTPEHGATIEFISNREGLVYLSGLSAGKYSAVISGYPDHAFPVIIPATSARQIDLGEIKLPIKP